MKIFFFLIVGMVLLITGCNSQKRAERSFVSLHVKHPAVVAKMCGVLYPPIDFLKDSIVYKQGNSELVFIHADCDSLRKVLPGVKTIKIPCPQTRKPDTYFVYKEKHLVNKAEVTQLQSVSVDCRSENEVLKSRNRLLMQVVLILASYTLLRWILRIWRISIP